MRKIVGIALALAALAGLLVFGSPSVLADDVLTASDECIEILKLEEGFSVKPYWDYTQYTVGFGTKCPDDMVDYYTENGITEQEAETLLRNHLAYVEEDLNGFAAKNSLSLSQNQFDALLLFSYNCGTGWVYTPSGTFYTAVASGATGNDFIRAIALWCSAGDKVQTFLLRRRLSEANMYLNGIYSQTPPDNYCYVLYDANGGTTSPRSQGYDSVLTAKPFPVPTYSGYTFAGWYTAKSGGEKVTLLDASVKGKTLYAHWTDGQGEETPAEEPTVTVTVTASDVNLRKGPGTNYTKIGTAQKGTKLTVVETAVGGSYTWGRYTENGGGWICLKYTNYDSALKELESQQPETEPETQPETEPETEPETTAPETEPETTEPTTTAPAEMVTKLMGTVKVSGYLRIRKGPGTGYAQVGKLTSGTRVEILEKKTVGATVWGRITQGWISLDYVKLDSTTSSGTTSSGTTSSGTTSSGSTTTTWTGTVVNCSQRLRIRKGAGTSYAIVGYYSLGAKITITEQKSVGSVKWGKTNKGWVSLDYVKLDSTTSSGTTSSGTTSSGTTSSGTTSSGTAATTWTGTVVNCSQRLRIRKGAGTSYSVVGYYSLGTKITITEQKSVGSVKWGKTDKGWVSLDYVKLDSTTSSGTTTSGTATSGKTYTVTANCLNVRSAAGTSNKIVAYIYYGAKVEVLETKQVGSVTWGRISTGWVSMKYLK